MEIVVLSLSVIALISGLYLRFTSLKHRTEFGRSVRWYHVRYWFAPWATAAILNERGLKLHATSTALIMTGVALYLIASGMPALL